MHPLKLIIEVLVTVFKSRFKLKRLRVVSLTEHLGDIIASEPIIREIKKDNADFFIIYVVNKKYSEALIGNLDINYIINVECLSDWIFLKKIYTRISKVYDLHIHKKTCATTGKKLYNPNLQGLNFENYFHYGNLLDVFSICAKIKCPNVAPKYNVPESINLTINTPEKYIVIQTTSNIDIKMWSRNKWEKLISLLNETYGIKVYEVGLNSAITPYSINYTNLCGKLSINQIALLIKKSSLFIGIDSSFGHLANSFSTPSLILLGNYFYFNKYCPYSGIDNQLSNINLIQYNGECSEIPLDLVFLEANKMLQ